MSNGTLRQELIDRYMQTGRIGLTQPNSYHEALSLIDTIVDLYGSENINEEEQKEYHFTLTEVANKLREFLDNY